MRGLPGLRRAAVRERCARRGRTTVRTTVVGIMADPGLPEKVAREVAEDLPRALSEGSGTDIS